MAKRAKVGRPAGVPNRLSKDTQEIVEAMVNKYGLLSPLEIAMFSVNHAYDTVKEILDDEGTLNNKDGQQALNTVNALVKTALPYTNHQLRNIVITGEDFSDETMESTIKKVKERILANTKNKTK